MYRPIIMLLTAAFFLSLGIRADSASACDGMKQASTAQTADARLININQLNTLLSHQSVYLIDSRSREAFSAGHIQGAYNLPLAEFDLRRLPADKNAKLVFYCGGPKCNLAPESARKAIQAGYANVYVFDGGWYGWTQGKDKTT